MGKGTNVYFGSAGYGRTHGWAGSRCINLGIRMGARIVFVSHYASTPHQRCKVVHVAKNSRVLKYSEPSQCVCLPPGVFSRKYANWHRTSGRRGKHAQLDKLLTKFDRSSCTNKSEIFFPFLTVFRVKERWCCLCFFPRSWTLLDCVQSPCFLLSTKYSFAVQMVSSFVVWVRSPCDKLNWARVQMYTSLSALAANVNKKDVTISTERGGV
ncbi:hypothetical protein CPB86DRAFT_162522 [Serendipita vermifera]|nr:hypothetical protein CPB86DRAFT_162522 [Serendipita vermifera]